MPSEYRKFCLKCVELVWFLNLFGVKVLISNLLKEQQATIMEFLWKTLAEDSIDLFAK